MHRAWYIKDVRLLIIELLEPRDLARVAQTCKNLFEIATDHLWDTLTSLTPFLCCLPPDYRSRQLKAEELQRLDFYSQKVKAIVLEEKLVENVIRLPLPFRLPTKKEKFLSKDARYHAKKAKNSGRSWNEVWIEIAELRPNIRFLPNLLSLRVSNIIEPLLLPFVGISGAHLSYIYIKYIHDRQRESLTQKFLDQLQDTSKLEYLFVRDGEPDLVPSKLIENSPLKQLRLDPRIHAGRHEDHQYKKFPLRPEILKKSTLENLTLGLTCEWYGPGVRAVCHKYLPALKTLWLNLRTFRPEPCGCRTNCVNFTPDSWTCTRDSFSKPYPPRETTDRFDCGRRSPILFLQGLDNPELDFLNIKFPYDVSGTMFLEVVRAAAHNCRLKYLTELVLDGGGWFTNCNECGARPPPKVLPQHMKDAMSLLLPLPKLKVLRLTVGPDFLKTLDLDYYSSLAAGLPVLQTLSLGHFTFMSMSMFTGTSIHERVPLQHLAAFCKMISSLVEVDIGCVDGLALEDKPGNDWACPHVKSLVVRHWVDSDANGRHIGFPRERLLLNLQTYFPNSDLAKKDFNPRLYMFEDH